MGSKGLNSARPRKVPEWIVVIRENYTGYKATKSNLPMQFPMRAHEGFSRVAFLAHTVKKNIPTSILLSMNKEYPTQVTELV